ncbi:class 3 adenylate cyclase [Bradyrhizobium diazoefficiens]|jgi:adenylate cyclase|uniref:Guanylate cyclase domain-containing protein n=1 Tax=Bradyrhizobium diazoefficiens TaxID=1355477 RepID=A0A0E4BQ90_9BRAD|nr:adenylate/guanylate cyclase domain-containing protein [Bradyrhizobium diazoefficiens]MBR0864110.1 adenylate/guanylate cyclase domain-containing protein [Bradyrhizobium diazoefficiens]MBR0888744.1 adenylate/guanylate cyclase domain-containing protein [Bradyrhizobium diazoefficiens]MBR0920505.1 adenylate/guanylate cyclase domain-containing protein [Bradyrhizobium diazoefficiens]WLA65793.1 adenylate/guanylate cyclase domain-containing protein [Bradyrhizobium diazoefficiens]BAR57244.1 hypotheti
MKRKIAAIFAADIAGYSRLVAEDEEETLRRLASYREVIDDFIAKANGRIFNTAGDAVLAEFPSAVDAVRCAIDIQESLRTRNMAYPPSRQMSFRIGITIGDVVERNGDLLGDGVNIAARLEGLAEVGGICVSRAVHEQVANKLSVQFADIGAQEVKNIPTPVHAYMVAMRREDGTYSKPQLKKPASKLAAAPVWMWPLVVAVVSVVAIVVTGFLYNTKLKQTATAVATPAATPSAAPSATPTQFAKAQVAPTAPPNAGAAMAPMPAPSPSASPMTGKFAADSVPFINERIRNYLAGDYSAAGDYKAFALNIGGFTGSALNQPNEEAARNAALDQCQKRADAAQSPRRCELYAVGNNVVYTHGKPPMPPSPYFRHDAMTERTFASKDFPMVRDPQKVRLENMFVPAAKSRSVALGPGGQYFMVLGSSSPEESARRALESCGAIAGVACMIVAVDDNFVVPIPTLLRITGFFHAASNASIVADARDEVVRKLADGMGWNAVAVGNAGRPGLGLKAADEQTAVNSALADCARRDSDCHVIAIGPFTVGPTN